MKDKIAQIQKELQHLERSYKSGIIGKQEYERNKEVIEKKLSNLELLERRDREVKRMIDDILDDRPPKKAAPETKKAPKPAPREITTKQIRTITEANTSYWKRVSYFFGILLVLLALLYLFSLENGAVTSPVSQEHEIEYYFDFECKKCLDGFSVLAELENNVSDLTITIKHFPLRNHQNADLAARSYLCAEKHGVADETFSWLFENQKTLDYYAIQGFLETQGISPEKHDACLFDNSFADAIQSDYQEGKEKGVTGVPTFLVNGVKLNGIQNIETLRAFLNQ